MRWNLQKMVLVSLVVSTMAGLCFGQRTTGTFAGIVTDRTGAVLPGADVQLVNEGTSATMQKLTGETGEFVYDFVPVGTYTLKIVMPGFKTYNSQGIPLGAAQNVRRTYVLEVGAVTDSVTVTGEVPLVNTLSPEQRISLETIEVRNLPMVNRNITNILEVGSGLTKGVATTGGVAGTRFRLNGLGGSAMSVTANGTDANGNAGSPTISAYGGFNKIDVMSSESVAEVQVVKGVIPAEYGSAMAGNMSLISKSGNNEWHGSLFHRYEGSVLSARSPILTSEPNSVWNQFGGSLGGPIQRDRTFFFFAYEGYRQRTSVDVNPTVPTPYFRNIWLTSLPFPETKTLLDYYPVPNQPYGPTDLLSRWVGPGIKRNNDDHVDAKWDYLVGGGNFSLSFSGGHPDQVEGVPQPLNPRTTKGRLLRASANYVIGRARWTSSTRVGLNQNLGQRIEKLWYEKDPIKGETVEGNRTFPQINFTGMTSLFHENRSWGIVPSYSFEQQFAFFRGTHSWKFGGSLSLPAGGQPDTTGPDISYQTLQDVQRNEPSSILFDNGKGPFTWRMINFGLFAQNDWRVNRKLVLNLGVRYDRYGHFVAKPWFESQPHALFILDGLIDPVNFLWGPLRDPKNPHESDNFSIAPRFGFAYTADNRGDFVVRGGFGVNFQGFDPNTFETYVGRTPQVPDRITFSRADAVARGLKWPVYREDMYKLIEAESGGRATPPGTRYNPNMSPPYAMNYTLGFQRVLTSTLVLESAFVGTRGVKFTLTRTYNPLDRVTARRPNPNDIQGTYNDSSQQTNYNSWQTTLKHRLTAGLLFNLHYTWGKAMSYTGGDISPGQLGDTRGSIQDFDAVKIERSPSTGDVTHSFVVDWVYRVPTRFANSTVARQALGGWQVSGIWRARTGIPLTISQTGGRPDIVNFNGAVDKNCCSYGNLQYLNPAAFQLVPVNNASSRTVRRGHAGAAPLRGPGQVNLDLSLGKSFSLGETKNLELKADMLNALNQTQYTGIATNMSGINFGLVTGTASARVIQLQLRFAF